ncbi:putative protein-conjugating enzyme UBE2F [Orchesella cincta]|uniref:E2 NEDD8-conjugating enzyme n=1 Tax=Orchesella cincta TaxID=48709 RepID=A0A1D2MQ76_ORCCI|nr:putative protein-conjugating enzyme UBE2F [Orchesella cincta]
MLTLTKKLRREQESRDDQSGGGGRPVISKERLISSSRTTTTLTHGGLLNESLFVQELNSALPSSCELKFDDPDKLHDFHLTITPDEGYWRNGQFVFHVLVTEEYNFAPPIVKCKTRLWHPNINEEGSVCLSLLRQSSIDEMGWAPTRRLKDVVWGLNSLFTDLLNFDDPLNLEASEMYQKDAHAFQQRVNEYIQKYSNKKGSSSSSRR